MTARPAWLIDAHFINLLNPMLPRRRTAPLECGCTGILRFPDLPSLVFDRLNSRLAPPCTRTDRPAVLPTWRSPPRTHVASRVRTPPRAAVVVSSQNVLPGRRRPPRDVHRREPLGARRGRPSQRCCQSSHKRPLPGIAGTRRSAPAPATLAPAPLPRPPDEAPRRHGMTVRLITPIVRGQRRRCVAHHQEVEAVGRKLRRRV